MRPILKAAMLAALVPPSGAAAAAPDGTTEHFFTITLTEGRTTDGKVQQYAVTDWEFVRAGGANRRESTGSIVTPDLNFDRERIEPGGGNDTVGANETLTVGGGRTESGLPTGKRQHKPFTITKEVDKSSPQMMQALAPPSQGSVRVRVKMPWLACRVGATYPRLELAGGGKRHVLEDVRVTSCGRSGGSPEESITFVYGKLG